MRHQCFADGHLALTLALGLPALLVFGVGIPFATWLMLFLKGHVLDSAACKQELGYVHKSYRLSRWWEGPMFQLKLLGLLLVIVNGRPLGTYLPALMTLCLLCFEHLYQQVLQPLKTDQLQRVRTGTVVLLIGSVIAGLILQDYEGEAAQAGLAAAAILMGIANCLFVAYLLYVTCKMYQGTVQRAVSNLNSKFEFVRQESGVSTGLGGV